MLLPAVIILLLSFFSFTKGHNILVYSPQIAHSHSVFLAKIADVLQEAGHNVTLLIPEIDGTQEVHAKKARVLIRSPPIKTEDTRGGIHVDLQEAIWTQWHIRIVRQFVMAAGSSLDDECKRLYADEQFIQHLSNLNFDFAIAEEPYVCPFGLFRKLGIKSYAIASPMSINENVAAAFGLPTNAGGQHVSTDYHPKMTFNERLYNILLPVLYKVFLWNHHSMNDPGQIGLLLDPSFDFKEELAMARFYFVNTDEHIDFPRPISHKLVYIGGITLDHKIGELNDDYRSIFENSQGVVVVTFGSLALSSQMPLDGRNAILAMFRAFPDISFIWKYEVEDDVAADLPNVYKRKWIPQKELLAHPKLLAIVSHGGMNSVLETCFAGKPMLAIPLFYDQARNAKMLEYRGTAVIVDKHEMTAETLIESLRKLTQGSTGEAYRHRASAIASMIAAKPLSGKERFIKYVNFAVQFKDEEDVLDIGHRKHGFIKYYNLDILGFIAFTVVATLYLFFVLMHCVWKTIFSNSQSKSKVQ